jgi:mRNA-degrading endonuclease HigB of HigAB toxin-antitoxin module
LAEGGRGCQAGAVERRLDDALALCEHGNAVWRDFHDVRKEFPDADQFKSLLIFNIRHNRCRLIVKVDYQAKLLMVKEFLTHNVYTRGE